MKRALLSRLERLESLPENRHSVCLRSGRTDCQRNAGACWRTAGTGEDGTGPTGKRAAELMP
jgi:hypothetical protein